VAVTALSQWRGTAAPYRGPYRPQQPSAGPRTRHRPCQRSRFRL